MKIGISDAIRNKINSELVEPGYFDYIKSSLSLRRLFACFDMSFGVGVEILHAGSIILGGLAAYMDEQNLSIISISLNVGSMTLKILQSCSKREAKELTAEVNTMFDKLDIESLPDLTIDNAKYRKSVSENSSSNQYAKKHERKINIDQNVHDEQKDNNVDIEMGNIVIHDNNTL